MRIERKGNVGRLTPRVERFFTQALGGVSLDSTQHAEARKADYKCLRGLLAIELKSLEEDASERVGNLTEKLQERRDWPEFHGSWPLQSVLTNMTESEDVSRLFIDRIGRGIKSHMRKANKQLAAHEAAFPRQNMFKVLVLVNEDHEVYDPKLSAQIIQDLLLRCENESPIYPHIDTVIFFTERHAASVNSKIAFPILCVESASIESTEWKRTLTDFIVSRWAQWNDVPLYKTDFGEQGFATIDHIPEQMRRQEQWELNYKRDPYMRYFTDEQLRERFDEIVCISALAFIRNSPLKPDKGAIMWSMSCMSHMMVEMGWRGIPITNFKYTPERLASAAKRMGMPIEVIAWFKSEMS
ncbi:MAG: hypothetical protein U5L06_06320 [Rhodovibrio sp.]|nr:hypothetical protein [Rhodovibrio sp.]